MATKKTAKSNRVFVKLNLVDNWGHKTVYLGPVVERPTGRGSEKEIVTPKIDKGGKYTVQWPDGTEEQVNVVMKKYYDTVDDMGHDYKVEGELPYIVIDHHGAPLTLMMADANIKVAMPVEK